MLEKKKSFQIPDAILEQLVLDENDEMMLDLENGKVTIYQKENTEMKGQAISLRRFLIPSLLATIVFFLFHYWEKVASIPLAGYDSLGTMVSILGTVTGVITATITFVRAKKGTINSQASSLYWRNFPALLVSFAIIIFIGSLYLFRTFNYMFPGMRFDLFTATFLFFVLMAILNYFVIYTMMELTPLLLTNLLTLVIIGGVLGAMLTNREKHWWHYNFSFLGTSEAANRWQFNLTLILSAVLMIALIDYLFVELKDRYGGIRLTILRWLLILIAVNLGGVGAFPYVENSLSGVIHNQVAANLVYLIIILILGMRWLLPKVTSEFRITSYIVMGLLVLTVVLFQGVHYFTLTAFELVAFLIAFVWLLMLFQYLQGIVLESEEQKKITLYLLNQPRDKKKAVGE